MLVKLSLFPLFQEIRQSLHHLTTVTTLHRDKRASHRSRHILLRRQTDMSAIRPPCRFHHGVGVSGHIRRPPLSRGERHQHPVGFLRTQERGNLSTAGRIARWNVKTQDVTPAVSMSNQDYWLSCRELHGGRRPSRVQEDVRQPSVLLCVRLRGDRPVPGCLQISGDRLQL